MRADLGQAARDLVRGQDEIDAATVDRAPRHATMCRGLFILCEGDPADRLHLAKPLRAIGSGAGKNDSHRSRLLVFGQRAE
jgi:hypothetical protein